MSRLKILAETSIILLVSNILLFYLYFADDGIVSDDETPGIIDILTNIGGAYMVVVSIITITLAISLSYMIIRCLTIKK